MLETALVVATIPVADLDRARTFYGETLGRKLLCENPASIRFGAGGDSQLSVFRRGPSTADHTVAHFEVVDIETAVPSDRSWWRSSPSASRAPALRRLPTSGPARRGPGPPPCDDLAMLDSLGG